MGAAAGAARTMTRLPMRCAGRELATCLYCSIQGLEGQGHAMTEQVSHQPETEQGKYVYCIIRSETPREFG